jgi:hypothetical protein
MAAPHATLKLTRMEWEALWQVVYGTAMSSTDEELQNISGDAAAIRRVIDKMKQGSPIS